MISPVVGFTHSGPAKPRTPELGPEQQVEDRAVLVVDDGAQAVGRGRIEERHEVRLVDVDRQLAGVDVRGRRARNHLPRGEGRRGLRDRLRVVERAEAALIGVEGDVHAPVRPPERLPGRAEEQRAAGVRGDDDAEEEDDEREQRAEGMRGHDHRLPQRAIRPRMRPARSA